MPQHTPGRTMHIGELAERTGLSLRTIRHYDDVGLLPASARTDGGFRVFTETDVDRLTHIKAMKPLGFSLEEITELLSIVEEPAPEAGRSNRAGHFLDRARHEREKLARYLDQADELITELEGLAGA
ncbi:MerR family transcriptional regulator [Arthrobacter rhombi]|uniref:MerR family transcriptional regulator n=1 Tax=Arthrobacter rhombi TaxID=71253 RepID=UPI003F8F77C6